LTARNLRYLKLGVKVGHGVAGAEPWLSWLFSSPWAYWPDA
jgi:hypothetical protein